MTVFFFKLVEIFENNDKKLIEKFSSFYQKEARNLENMGLLKFRI